MISSSRYRKYKKVASKNKKIPERGIFFYFYCVYFFSSDLQTNDTLGIAVVAVAILGSAAGAAA